MKLISLTCSLALGLTLANAQPVGPNFGPQYTPGVISLNKKIPSPSGIIYVSTNGSSAGDGSIYNPYNNLGIAKSNASWGQTIVVYPGYYTGAGLLKDGVNWYFYEGTYISPDPADIAAATGGVGYAWGAIFADNYFVSSGNALQYGYTTNSLSCSIMGRLSITNCPCPAFAVAGPNSRINVEMKELSFDPTFSDPYLTWQLIFSPMNVVLMQLPDFYGNTKNQVGARSEFNFKADIVSGMIYLSECDSYFQCNTYTNVTFWFDRDSTNNINAQTFRGNQWRGAATKGGHNNGSLITFDIPIIYTVSTDILGSGQTNLMNDMGTIFYKNATIIQGASNCAPFFLTTLTGYANEDWTNSAILVLDNCTVIGSLSNTNQAVFANNPKNRTNNPAMYVIGNFATYRAATNNLPSNLGPGNIVSNDNLRRWIR